MIESTDLRDYKDNKHWYATTAMHLSFSPSLPSFDRSKGTIYQGIRGNGFCLNNEDQVGEAKFETLLELKAEAEAGRDQIEKVLKAIDEALLALEK